MSKHEEFLDATTVNLDSDTDANAAKSQKSALTAAMPEAKEKREAWRAERRSSLKIDENKSEYYTKKVLDLALEQQQLCGEYTIYVRKKDDHQDTPVSVAEILADKKGYHGLLTRDPIEPDYDGERLVGVLFLDGKQPKLASQARGSTTYSLFPTMENATAPRERIEYCPETNDLFVDACCEKLLETGSFFKSGSTVVQMRNGEVYPVTEFRLTYEITKYISVYQKKRTGPPGGRNYISLSKSLICQILEVSGDRLPALNGFADYPLVLADGSVVSEPGHDKSSGLFVLNGTASFPEFFEHPTDDQIMSAVQTCLKPFRKYTFEDEAYGRSATLFAVMIAVLRPALSCAPMIVTTSNATGVGKGYFQQALAIIRTGTNAEFRNIERTNAPEFRKTLFTMIYEGKSVIALDNIDGALKNETLSSFITAPIWSDRVLGQTKSGGALRNSALLLLNGCKVDFGKNIVRKVLRIGLADGKPGHRFHDFGFLPPDDARKHRTEIIGAALTLANYAKNCEKAAGTIGSFEEVNSLIRRPIAHIAKNFPELGLIDPIGLFKDLVENDVDTPEEADILKLIHDEMGSDEFDTNDLREKLVNGMVLDAAIRELCSSSPVMSSHSIGAILHQLRGEARDGLILKSRKLGGKNMWCIQKVE